METKLEEAKGEYFIYIPLLPVGSTSISIYFHFSFLYKIIRPVFTATTISAFFLLLSGLNTYIFLYIFHCKIKNQIKYKFKF